MDDAGRMTMGRARARVIGAVLVAVATSVVPLAAFADGTTNHGREISKATVDADPPTADLEALLATDAGPVESAAPFALHVLVTNWGEIAAQNLVAVVSVPVGWGIAKSSASPSAGVSCAIVSSSRALRCTRKILEATNGRWRYDAVVTPPSGTGSGVVSLTVTTTTPESPDHGNTSTGTFVYQPPDHTRTLTIAPNTSLEDGEHVTLTGTGFVPGTNVGYCEAVVTGHPARTSDCGATLGIKQADSTGAFSADATLNRFLVVDGKGVLDCASLSSVCGMAAADIFAAGGASVISALTFTPQAPVDDPFHASIEGTVIDSGGHPLASAPVAAYTDSDSWVGSLNAMTDAAGHYVLAHAEPGIHYRIRFGAPAGSPAVPEWYGGLGSDGARSRESAFDVSPRLGAFTVEADATLVSGGGIAGTVVAAGGSPVANATVWAYRDTDAFVGTYAATTQADGTYRIDGIQSGLPVRVRFAPPPGSGLASEWFDNVASRSAAPTVTPTEGGTITANAQLDP